MSSRRSLVFLASVLLGVISLITSTVAVAFRVQNDFQSNYIYSRKDLSQRSNIHDRSNMLRGNFLASIKYWDIDEIENMPERVKSQMKQSIIKELLRHEETDANDACICSRILLPFVCDSNGQLHSNICRFHCSRSKSSGIEDVRPTMILTETSFQKSKELCQTRFGKHTE